MERRASTVLVASQHNLTPAPHPNPNQAPHGAARERAHEWMMAPHGWSGADLCVSPLTSARFVGMNGEEAVGVGGGDARLTPVPHAPVFETKWLGLRPAGPPEAGTYQRQTRREDPVLRRLLPLC